MTDQKKHIDVDSFIRRNSAIRRGNLPLEEASDKAEFLAKEFANVLKKHGGNYYDVNQAVIILDNGFYEKTLRTDCHIPTLE